MIEKLKNKKTHIAVTFGAIAAGVLLFQSGIPTIAHEPKIDALSPNQGPVGTQVTISGSGFTTAVQGIVSTKVKDTMYAPGNYILIKDEVVTQPILSSDGKTLTVRIDLISDKIRTQCEDKFSKKDPEPCKVPIKVVNAYGKPSNDVQFTITGREYKKLTYTIEKLALPAPAVIHAVVPGQTWNGDDVMRIRISAPATNGDTITGVVLALATEPNTLGDISQPCAYFYPTNPPDSSLASDGTRVRMTEGLPTYWGGSLGTDGGIFTWPPQSTPIGCAAYIGGFPLAPGTHRDFTVYMKMYAQNYALKADGTYTPPADQSKTFSLKVKARALYFGSGYYVVDNSPENGYDSTFNYLGYGGNEFNRSFSTLITSDPIKIIPQSIPTPSGYFP